eukprot:TRINITY_DN104164_c0_g1_i1.p1 TRINITY_DN104164_c0_g1~~TRINITY_DN104164_c0_g1_i1.p1  ORF type:complete len:343 (-),score=49.54 TRINITY_DN104164_c0_g1_i1:122-1150(-)
MQTSGSAGFSSYSSAFGAPAAPAADPYGGALGTATAAGAPSTRFQDPYGAARGNQERTPLGLPQPAAGLGGRPQLQQGPPGAGAGAAGLGAGMGGGYPGLIGAGGRSSPFGFGGYAAAGLGGGFGGFGALYGAPGAPGAQPAGQPAADAAMPQAPPSNLPPAPGGQANQGAAAGAPAGFGLAGGAPAFGSGLGAFGAFGAPPTQTPQAPATPTNLSASFGLGNSLTPSPAPSGGLGSAFSPSPVPSGLSGISAPFASSVAFEQAKADAHSFKGHPTFGKQSHMMSSQSPRTLHPTAYTDPKQPGSYVGPTTMSKTPGPGSYDPFRSSFLKQPTSAPVKRRSM